MGPLDFPLYIFLLQCVWVRDGPKTDEPPSQEAHIGPFYTGISVIGLSSRVPCSSFVLILSNQKSGKKFTSKRHNATILTAYLRVRTRHTKLKCRKSAKNSWRKNPRNIFCSTLRPWRPPYRTIFESKSKLRSHDNLWQYELGLKAKNLYLPFVFILRI